MVGQICRITIRRLSYNTNIPTFTDQRLTSCERRFSISLNSAKGFLAFDYAEAIFLPSFTGEVSKDLEALGIPDLQLQHGPLWKESQGSRRYKANELLGEKF